MDERRRLELARNLGAKDHLPTILEVNRLSESFLAAQLQSVLASDLRALTLAAVLAALIAGAIGAVAIIVASGIHIGWHILPLLVFCGALIAALRAAIHAARPAGFGFAGNNPRFWELYMQKALKQTAP